MTNTDRPLTVGDIAPDGSVFAGLTPDGSQRIYVMPRDLAVTMIFNTAATAVRNLNADKALGHDDWQIPTAEHLRVLYQNQDVGALKGTFSKKPPHGSYFTPDSYWSSTERPGYPGGVHIVQFTDGVQDWTHTDEYRLSCRPVRIVAHKPPGAAP